MAKPSSTNYPNGFLVKTFSHSLVLMDTKYCSIYRVDKIKVVIAARSHLFPFRTEKLSSLTPMVLHLVVGE